jgi:outer membrane protein assembly factor BamB
MKKLTILMFTLCMMGTLPTQAQFGKLLDKVKGKSGAGKKSGSFATTWESEFDNKATRLALANADGTYIIGTDDNSATVLDGSGKMIWSGDYKKITTNNTNNSEFQYVVWKEKGGYLFLFDARKLGTDRVAVIDIATGKELWNSELYQNYGKQFMKMTWTAEAAVCLAIVLARNTTVLWPILYSQITRFIL